MNFRFVHLSIAPFHLPMNFAPVEMRVSQLSRDWLRYNSLSWILWTNKSTVTISEMVSEDLQPADQLLVMALSTTEPPTGRLPAWAWEWVNRPRDSVTGEIRTPALPAPAAENQFRYSGSPQASSGGNKASLEGS